MKRITFTDYFNFSSLNRKLIIVILAALFAVLFHEPIELFLDKTVVLYFLKFVKSHPVNDTIFIFVGVFSVFFTVFKVRKIDISNLIFLIATLITVFYSSYRVSETVWTFTPFAFSSSIKYTDIFFVLYICSTILFLTQNLVHPPKTSKSFFEDIPIELNETNDELGYSHYAKIVADKINTGYFEHSFAIGINAPWGIGKTSFIKAVKHYLKCDDIIPIEMEPWNTNTENAIILDFFDVVQEKVRPFRSSLSDTLINYSQKIVLLNDNEFSQSILKSISASDSLARMIEKINKGLKQINKKLVIYIDDLDRLDTEEIIQVIKLIRKTANFHNTVFIVAYDRNYLINALNEHNSYKKERFLEKIFQIEINLPHFDRSSLRRRMIYNLKQRFDKKYHRSFEDVIFGSSIRTSAFLDEWLFSMRDVTRLSNSLVLNLDQLIGEILFEDFLKLELLRINYPSVYELLYRNSSEFFDNTTKFHNAETTLNLKPNKESDSLSGAAPKVVYPTKLARFLYKNQNALSLPENEIPKILDLVDDIFDENSKFTYQDEKHLSVIYPLKFERYFSYNLGKSLSEVEFNHARANFNLEEFSKKITSWVENKLEFELLNKIYKIVEFENQEDFEKIISIIFYLANQKSQYKDYKGGLVGYEGMDLSNKLYNENNILAKRFYSEDNEKLKTFIKGFFLNAKSPFHFESEFIHFLNDSHHVSFVLSNDELKVIVHDYLKTYFESVDEFDYNVWSLFGCCKQAIWTPTGSGSYTKLVKILDETKEIFKNYSLNKLFDSFIFYVFYANKSEGDGVYYLNDYIRVVFGSWDEFYNSLIEKENEDRKYFKEFKEFMTVYKNNGYRGNLNFEFKTIPLNLIRNGG